MDEAPELQKLLKVCQDWINKNKVRCAESIYQMDNVQEALPDLAEAVCEVVGYYIDIDS